MFEEVNKEAFEAVVACDIVSILPQHHEGGVLRGGWERLGGKGWVGRGGWEGVDVKGWVERGGWERVGWKGCFRVEG